MGFAVQKPGEETIDKHQPIKPWNVHGLLPLSITTPAMQTISAAPLGIYIADLDYTFHAGRRQPYPLGRNRVAAVMLQRPVASFAIGGKRAATMNDNVGD